MTQKEQFKNMKNSIEDERKLLDRTVEKLQKEVRKLEFLLNINVRRKKIY